MGHETGRGAGEDVFTVHGGNLAAARARFKGAPEPWLDLSTGINPIPYPIPPIPAAAWTRLPEADAVAALEAAAARAYGAADPATVVAAPGTQALIQLLPRLIPARDVRILGFTYAEHARCWSRQGATVKTVDRPVGLAGADVAVIVNPNNPDGRLVAPDGLAGLARQTPRTTFVLDEAFADVLGPAASLVPKLPAKAVILRSFGKTYGLAGLRLGFAVTSRPLAERLREAIGPWAVSGAAIAIGAAALGDNAWLNEASGAPGPRRRPSGRPAGRCWLRPGRRHAPVPLRANRRRHGRIHRARPAGHPGPPLRRPARRAALRPAGAGGGVGPAGRTAGGDGRDMSLHPSTRHARAWPGHPRLHFRDAESWVAGPSPAMTAEGLRPRHNVPGARVQIWALEARR